LLPACCHASNAAVSAHNSTLCSFSVPLPLRALPTTTIAAVLLLLLVTDQPRIARQCMLSLMRSNAPLSLCFEINSQDCLHSTASRRSTPRRLAENPAAQPSPCAHCTLCCANCRAASSRPSTAPSVAPKRRSSTQTSPLSPPLLQGHVQAAARAWIHDDELDVWRVVKAKDLPGTPSLPTKSGDEVANPRYKSPCSGCEWCFQHT
jgi:hypothetical protein